MDLQTQIQKLIDKLIDQPVNQSLKSNKSKPDYVYGSVDDFISETLVECPGGQIKLGDVWRSYQQWCKSRDERPIILAKFPQAIRDNNIPVTSGRYNKHYVRNMKYKTDDVFFPPKAKGTPDSLDLPFRIKSTQPQPKTSYSNN